MVRDNSGSTERRGHGPMWSHRGRAWDGTFLRIEILLQLRWLNLLGCTEFGY
jgi:hypothetical protein